MTRHSELASTWPWCCCRGPGLAVANVLAAAAIVNGRDMLPLIGVISIVDDGTRPNC